MSAIAQEILGANYLVHNTSKSPVRRLRQAMTQQVLNMLALGYTKEECRLGTITGPVVRITASPIKKIRLTGVYRVVDYKEAPVSYHVLSKKTPRSRTSEDDRKVRDIMSAKKRLRRRGR